MRYFPLNNEMTCRQAPRHKQNELTTVKPALFPEPSPPPGARRSRGAAHSGQAGLPRARVGAFSVAQGHRGWPARTTKFCPPAGEGMTYRECKRKEETHPSPGRRAPCFFGRPPAGRHTATRFQEGSVFGSTPPASHFCPGHPRAADLSSPLPSTQTIPLQLSKPDRPLEPEPQGPQVPRRPRLPAPARCVRAQPPPSAVWPARRSRRCGAAGTRAQTCGGGGVGPSFHPTEFKGAPLEGS